MPNPHKQMMARFDAVLRRIEQSIYTPVSPLQIEAWLTKEPVSFSERRSGEHRKLDVGDRWGELFDCAWFRLVGSIPKDAAGKPVVLVIDLSGEACVVDDAGDPILGLTTVASGYDFSLGSPGKRIFPLTGSAIGGEPIDVWADAGNNDLFGEYRNKGTVVVANVAVLNPQMRDLYYDFEVLRDLLKEIPAETARYHTVRQALYGAVEILSQYTDKEVEAARAFLAPELAKRGGDPSLTVSSIGHAHIDLAWLWPIRETIRKGARTFSTVLAMMDRYPDYHFGASQPQLYQWMKDHYPALYRRIKERIAEGRWEAQGCMWVESDSNVPSGESLVRQCLYGKRFFRDEFNVDIDCLWQPDVFGYCGTLPQILVKSGVKYFMTQKLSWSEINRHPHHTFHWIGLDGSRVLAHMPPEDTYNGSAAPRALAKIEREYLDKGVSADALMLFGIGDGGGGPGEEHLERLQRQRNLAGLPPTVQEPSVKLFDRLSKTGEKYAAWHGELYLEKHQGTLTTQARNKRYNRKLEFALRELELSSVLAHKYAGQPYPTAALDRIWKEFLLYQFHDILPGSSITRVYTESLARYAELTREVAELTSAADTAWATATGGGTLVVNSLSWPRREWLKVDGNWTLVSAPALGCAPAEADRPQVGLIATPEILENDALRVAFGKDGEIISIYDKDNDREALTDNGRGNVLSVYEDHGDAWDFAIDYDRHAPVEMALEQSEAFVDGPNAVVRQVRRIGKSTLTQEIVLTAGSRRVEFRTSVDWQESARMLRTSFPVGVYSPTARCEIQFGNIERPTHKNTTWDMAKFEICGHKWVDISDHGYGVALLNDCKYGHRVHDGVLDLNLLRSPHYPDPVADRAQHEFIYAIFPHSGDYTAGGVVREGYSLNVPLRVLTAPAAATGSGVPAGSSWLSVDADNIVIDTVKKSEDGDDIIVRIYEAHGASTRTKVKIGLPASKVNLVNLLEEDPKALRLHDGAVELSFGPFEIHTLRIE